MERADGMMRGEEVGPGVVVADHKAVETPLLAQHARQEVGVTAGRHPVDAVVWRGE